MKTLPFIPVETLAMQTAAKSYSAMATAPRNNNPGIVPPWLLKPVVTPVAPTHPVGDQVPRILAATQATSFDPTPVEVDDQTPRIWG